MPVVVNAPDHLGENPNQLTLTFIIGSTGKCIDRPLAMSIAADRPNPSHISLLRHRLWALAAVISSGRIVRGKLSFSCWVHCLRISTLMPRHMSCSAAMNEAHRKPGSSQGL